jgi:hypothetical protein
VSGDGRVKHCDGGTWRHDSALANWASAGEQVDDLAFGIWHEDLTAVHIYLPGLDTRLKTRTAVRGCGYFDGRRPTSDRTCTNTPHTLIPGIQILNSPRTKPLSSQPGERLNKMFFFDQLFLCCKTFHSICNIKLKAQHERIKRKEKKEKKRPQTP